MKKLIKEKKQKYMYFKDAEDDPLEDPAVKANPYYIFGFGVVIYLKIIYKLMILFGIISILQLPIMIGNRFIFSGSLSSGLDSFSIGNIGYSGIFCAST